MRLGLRVYNEKWFKVDQDFKMKQTRKNVKNIFLHFTMKQSNPNIFTLLFKVKKV